MAVKLPIVFYIKSAFPQNTLYPPPRFNKKTTNPTKFIILQTGFGFILPPEIQQDQQQKRQNAIYDHGNRSQCSTFSENKIKIPEQKNQR